MLRFVVVNLHNSVSNLNHTGMCATLRPNDLCKITVIIDPETDFNSQTGKNNTDSLLKLTQIKINIFRASVVERRKTNVALYQFTVCLGITAVVLVLCRNCV